MVQEAKRIKFVQLRSAEQVLGGLGRYISIRVSVSVFLGFLV